MTATFSHSPKSLKEDICSSSVNAETCFVNFVEMSIEVLCFAGGISNVVSPPVLQEALADFNLVRMTVMNVGHV